MRILHLADYGGPYSGSFIPMLGAAARAAAERGWETELVFSGARGGRAWPAGLERAGLRPRFVPAGTGAATVAAIADLLGAAPGPALLHCHFSRFDVAAVRAARARAGTAVVWHVHTTMRSGGARVRMRNAARFGLFGRDVAAILCVAPHLAQEAIGRLAPAGRVGVLPNAIDTERFRPPAAAGRAAARTALGLQPDAQVLLHFGWDWGLKGGDSFLRAVRRLRSEGRAVAAITVGGGEPARRAASALGLGGAVRVLDPVEDVAGLYGTSDVFVSASRSEGMPYSVAEALACGAAVVASDLPGHALIGAGLDACLLTEPEEVPLAEAIARQLDRPVAERASAAAAARSRIVERLDLSAWAAALMEHYELAAARPARPRRRATPRTGGARVVTLVDHLGGHRGGAERIALELAVGLAERGRDSVFCATRFTLDEVAKPQVVVTLRALRQAGVRFVGLPRRRRWALWDWMPLVRELRDADVVLHAHKFGSNVWAVLLGRALRVPLVVAHEHSFPPGESLARRLLTRHLVGRLADVVVAVSAADRARLARRGGRQARRLVHVPNAIRGLEPSGADLRAELGIAPASPVLVSVGGLRPVKGFDVLARAVAALLPELPALRALIVGYGPPEEVARLRALLESIGVAEAVLLLGNRRDVADCLAAADVAVCASRWEGQSLSLLEYMDAARPVVATRVGGNAELLDPSGAILVEAGDPDALAAAIRELLADPVRAAAMGAANRARRREHFGIERLLDRVEAIYDGQRGRRLTAARRAAAAPCYGSRGVRGGHGGP